MVQRSNLREAGGRGQLSLLGGELVVPPFEIQTIAFKRDYE
jgi:hypothetical protein